MKKISILFIALVLGLTSCTKEDSPSNVSGDLLGVWNGKTVDYSGTTTTTIQGQTIETSYVGEGFNVDYAITISENPNLITSEGSYGIKLTTTVFGQSQVQEIPNLSFSENATWSRNGDEITMINDGQSIVYKIVELTTDSLIITTDTVLGLPQSGGSSTTDIEMIITFSR